MATNLTELKNNNKAIAYYTLLGYGDDVNVLEGGDGATLISLARKKDNKDSIYKDFMDANDAKLHVIMMDLNKPLGKTTCSLINKKAEKFLYEDKFNKYLSEKGVNADAIKAFQEKLANIDSTNFDEKLNNVIDFIGKTNNHIANALFNQTLDVAKKINFETSIDNVALNQTLTSLNSIKKNFSNSKNKDLVANN